MQTPGSDASECLEQHLEGCSTAAGLRDVRAGLLETLAWVGAALNGLERGRVVVGLEHHTSVLRAARSGVARGAAVQRQVQR